MNVHATALWLAKTKAHVQATLPQVQRNVLSFFVGIIATSDLRFHHVGSKLFIRHPYEPCIAPKTTYYQASAS